MRAEIVAELATAHGGDIQLAKEMIAAAAEAGADTVKTQAYGAVNPNDPQADWLEQSRLGFYEHEVLMQTAKECGLQYLSTPFDADSLQMLRDLGLTRFKIASSESGNGWWKPVIKHDEWLVSYPWGRWNDEGPTWYTRLTAIPLYPTPMECVGQARLLDGWSDHCVGTAACLYALARGAKVIECHFTIEGARKMPFDKTADDIRQIRQFAEACATISTGVSEQFRTRWRTA